MSRQAPSPNRVLEETERFRYMIADEAHAESIVHVLSEAFCREPMAEVLHATDRDLAPMVRRFLPECATNGLSVIAVLRDDPSTVAGVFLNRDFKSPLPAGIADEFAWFRPIGEALATVTQAYEAERPDIGPGEVVELALVGVASPRRARATGITGRDATESDFVRKGIARKLFRLSARVARNAGFKRCVCKCTSCYAQGAARRVGYQDVARMAYQDFRFGERAMFADVEPPHTHLVLLEKELES